MKDRVDPVGASAGYPRSGWIAPVACSESPRQNAAGADPSQGCVGEVLTGAPSQGNTRKRVPGRCPYCSMNRDRGENGANLSCSGLRSVRGRLAALLILALV